MFRRMISLSHLAYIEVGIRVELDRMQKLGNQSLWLALGEVNSDLNSIVDGL